MDQFNPFMQFAGVPGAMPGQMATGAQMPGMQGGMNPMHQADRLQKLGKLFSAMGNFQQPPKGMPMQPQQPMQQGANVMMQGAGNMLQGAGMRQSQVPPADIMMRLMQSLSPFGG